MITLEPIGHVRSSRTDLSDDNWAGVTARIELVEALPCESLDGIEAFSHAESAPRCVQVPGKGSGHAHF
jgi:tRNA (Thr-GGU) A37 N-methylase